MAKINKGYKVFISYKYADSSVFQFPDRMDEKWQTTARHYVDIIQENFENLAHINKGEKDGEDLSEFKDETIKSHLRNKIYDSRVTIVLISPNMRDHKIAEDNQWIPWEIKYSLKETTRNDRTSRRNSILGVVLPDRYGRYGYAFVRNNCVACSCVNYPLTNSFTILKALVLNRKNPDIKTDCSKSDNVLLYPHSYMHLVTWVDFLKDISGCLDTAVDICDRGLDWSMPNIK